MHNTYLGYWFVLIAGALLLTASGCENNNGIGASLPATQVSVSPSPTQSPSAAPTAKPSVSPSASASPKATASATASASPT